MPAAVSRPDPTHPNVANKTVTSSRNIIGWIVTHEQPIPSPAMVTEDSSVTRMLVTVVLLHRLCYSFEFVQRVMNFTYLEYMGAVSSTSTTSTTSRT